jgi:hypothetical protein
MPPRPPSCYAGACRYLMGAPSRACYLSVFRLVRVSFVSCSPTHICAYASIPYLFKLPRLRCYDIPYGPVTISTCCLAYSTTLMSCRRRLSRPSVRSVSGLRPVSRPYRVSLLSDSVMRLCARRFIFRNSHTLAPPWFAIQSRPLPACWHMPARPPWFSRSRLPRPSVRSVLRFLPTFRLERLLLFSYTPTRLCAYAPIPHLGV